MLIYGTKEYFTQLIGLWQDAFGDPESLILFFLENTVEQKEIYISEKNGCAEGVLYALPCTIEGKSGYYWYALTTRKEERGKGIMGSLMKKAAHDAEQKGASFIWLQPATDELFLYYEKNGFTDRIPRSDRGETNVYFPDNVKDYMCMEAEEAGEPEEDLPTDCLFRWFGEKLITELHGAFPV
ncbi:MAG: GNAT family N-acetyltransferase [Eubacterium sp.]|nr:GNAT family N-acetyltransferase [Eubacterium sp.]